MLRVTIGILCLVLAIEAAGRQDTCIYTNICVQENGNCTTDGNIVPICAKGTYCDPLRNCTKLFRLGDSCTSDGGPACYDQQYPSAITCATQTQKCQYSGIYYPGEPCKYNNSLYDNGGCVSTTCDPNGFCAAGNESSDCLNNPNSCGPLLYCNSSGVCTPRGGLNDSCTSNTDCAPEYVCSALGLDQSSFCTVPFSAGDGDGCDQLEDCAAGLYCDANYTCHPPPVPPTENCFNQTQICGSGSCMCGITSESPEMQIENGVGTCGEVPTLNAAYISQFVAFQTCAKQAGCADFWIRTQQSSSLTFKVGPSLCVASCTYNLLAESAGLPTGTCFDIPVTTQPPATTLPPTTTQAPVTVLPTTAVPTTSAPITQAKFTIQLQSCLSGPNDPQYQQLLNAFAAAANISASQIVLIPPANCPALSRQTGTQSYGVQVTDTGGNALALAKDITDAINGNTLVDAPGLLVTGAGAATEPEIVTATTAPPTTTATTSKPTTTTTSMSASLSVLLGLIIASLLVLIA